MFTQKGWQNTTTNGKYIVSTVKVPMTGWETLVFPIINGEVDYIEVDGNRYGDSESLAYVGHLTLFEKWENNL